MQGARNHAGRDRRPWVALAILIPVLVWSSSAFGSAVTAPRAATIEATISTSPRSAPVARDFVGLSFESYDLPFIARLRELPSLLRSIGPGVMRFGGDSLDTGVPPDDRLPGAGRRSPPISVRDLRALRRILISSGWRAIVGIPLPRSTIPRVVREAHLLSTTLGPTLDAVTLGNEPNAYWLSGLRPPSWGLSQYVSEIRAYRTAIRSEAPGVRIAGPDTVTSLTPGPLPEFDGFAWMTGFAARIRPDLLTAHFYPLTRCLKPVTVAALIGPHGTAVASRVLSRLAWIGTRSRTPVRLTETNSVGCGGQPGVSNTFAPALWAVRTELMAMRFGLVGINLHSLIHQCAGYSPLCVPDGRTDRSGAIELRPVWYALTIAARLSGLSWTPLVQRNVPAGLSLDGLASPDRIAVVGVTNASPSAHHIARVSLPWRSARATLVRLTAPSLGSTAGITLGEEPVAVRPAPATGTRFATVSFRVPDPGVVVLDVQGPGT